ncbi:MAG: YIP1 family protein [Candidatus Aenigmarchaeota archaeon]|nr:YIP1 family protein [Candidatus Aenigmarchaeota archaeon]
MARKERGGMNAEGIFRRIIFVMRSPSGFFSRVKGEKGFRNAFIFYAVISFISSVLSLLAPYPFNLLGSFPMLGQGFVIAIFLVFWLLGLLLSFVVNGFFHLFVMLLGGKGGYHNTYKAFSYGSAPSAILGWISYIFPGISPGIAGTVLMLVAMIFFIIWGFYITIKGLSILHKMSTWRSLGVILIPAGIFALLAAILLMFAFILAASYGTALV